MTIWRGREWGIFWSTWDNKMVLGIAFLQCDCFGLTYFVQLWPHHLVTTETVMNCNNIINKSSTHVCLWWFFYNFLSQMFSENLQCYLLCFNIVHECMNFVMSFCDYISIKCCKPFIFTYFTQLHTHTRCEILPMKFLKL